MSQDATLQHYMDYNIESLTPVMAHIAKNIVKVNEGQTKHMVNCWHKSWITVQFQTWWHNCTLDYVFVFFVFFQAVKGKYSTSKQMRIASISQLRSSVVKDLAKLAH